MTRVLATAALVVVAIYAGSIAIAARHAGADFSWLLPAAASAACWAAIFRLWRAA